LINKHFQRILNFRLSIFLIYPNGFKTMISCISDTDRLCRLQSALNQSSEFTQKLETFGRICWVSSLVLLLQSQHCNILFMFRCGSLFWPSFFRFEPPHNRNRLDREAGVLMLLCRGYCLSWPFVPLSYSLL